MTALAFPASTLPTPSRNLGSNNYQIPRETNTSLALDNSVTSRIHRLECTSNGDSYDLLFAKRSTNKPSESSAVTECCYSLINSNTLTNSLVTKTLPLRYTPTMG